MDKTLDQRNKCWLEIERQDKLLAECRDVLYMLADRTDQSDDLELIHTLLDKLPMQEEERWIKFAS